MTGSRRIPNEVRAQIIEFATEFGKPAASKKFGVTVQFVYGLFRDSKFSADKIDAPEVPTTFSNEYIQKIGRSACNVGSMQPGEVLSAIATLPAICDELIELRRKVARMTQKPTEIEKMTVVQPAQQEKQKPVNRTPRQGGWNAKEW